MSVRVSQEVLEVVIAPDTVAVRVSQEVIEVVIHTGEADNPVIFAGRGGIRCGAMLYGSGTA